MRFNYASMHSPPKNRIIISWLTVWWLGDDSPPQQTIMILSPFTRNWGNFYLFTLSRIHRYVKDLLTQCVTLINICLTTGYLGQWHTIISYQILNPREKTWPIGLRDWSMMENASLWLIVFPIHNGDSFFEWKLKNFHSNNCTSLFVLY